MFIVRRCKVILLLNFDEGMKMSEKKTFLNNLGLFFITREKDLNKFKSRLFQLKDLDKIP